jgi:hypothetical protein
MQWEMQDRDEIERQLLAALQEAKLAYEQARVNSIQAREIAAAAGRINPDGVLAGRLANRQSAAAFRALARYRQVLGWFTEFAITGNPPGNDEP